MNQMIEIGKDALEYTDI